MVLKFHGAAIRKKNVSKHIPWIEMMKKTLTNSTLKKASWQIQRGSRPASVEALFLLGNRAQAQFSGVLLSLIKIIENDKD